MRWRLDAKEIRRALSEPRQVCDLLGLSEGSKPQRNGLFVLCPAHQEKTPSCSVTGGPDGTVRVRCFGCGWTGDALNLVALVNGLDVDRDFVAVLAEAAKLAGLRPGHRRVLSAARPRPAQALAPDLYDRLITALLERCPLEPDTAAAQYLMGRTRGAAICAEARRAGWGALPDGAALSEVVRELADRFGADTLLQADLISSLDNLRVSAPRHRLLIPYRTPTGEIQTLQRRRIGDGESKYLFPKGRPAAFPYGAEARLRKRSSVMFVEGAIDVLDRRVQYRETRQDRLVLGIPGLAAWKPEWALLARSRVVRIALDNDGAGEGAYERIAADCLRAATTVIRTTPADGRKDWNSPSKDADG